MGIFHRKHVEQEPAAVPPPAPSPPPAAPVKPPIDVELTNMLEPPKPPKKTREGRLSAQQWRLAYAMWKQCKNATEVAAHFKVTPSAVCKRIARDKWDERAARESVTDVRESQAAIVARVNEQVARLQPEDREALVVALRADHVRLAAELKATAMEAIGRLGIDRVTDAIRLLDLGVSIEQGLVGDKGNDHRSLTLVLQQQRERFAVKPKIKVSEGGDQP